MVQNVNGYSHQRQEVQVYATPEEQINGGQDQNSWENLYPGWKFDANTGQWYQVNDAPQTVQASYNSNTASEWIVSDQKTDPFYLQQNVQSVAEKDKTESVTSWISVSQANHTNVSLSNQDHASQQNNGYPSHMFFDPQYPGWYYDMNTQQWCSLDAYNSQSIVQAQVQVNLNGFSATNTFNGNDQGTYSGQEQLSTQSFSNVEQQGSTFWQPAQHQVNQNGFSDGFSATNTYHGNDQKPFGEGQDQLVTQSGFEGFSRQGQDYNSKGSFNNVEHQGSTMWQPEAIAKSVPTSDFRGNNQFVPNSHSTSFLVDNQHQSFQRSDQFSYEFHVVTGAQCVVPIGNFNQSFSQSPGEMMMNVPKTYESRTYSGYSQQPIQNGQQVSYATPTAGRSSAGRPPHALVTFGFNGKLIVMKNTNALINQSYGSQDSNGGSIFVHNMAEAFTGGTNVSSSYFDTLCRQSFPGPLTRNFGGKELSKWIDERITDSEFSNMDYRNSEVLKLLFSLLKIASQHYGKLRSPFGTDATSKENDAPEVAVARLFASVSKNTAGYSDYGHFTQCLQQLPSERDTQVERWRLFNEHKTVNYGVQHLFFLYNLVISVMLTRLGKWLFVS